MSKYLQKDLFKKKYNICADIVFGKYKNKYLQWDSDVNKNIILKWTSTCNLNGEEGIICEFNGTGWAGWCKVNKCYLVYDTDIDNNENIVMKIIDFSKDTDYLSIKLQELEKNRIMKNNSKEKCNISKNKLTINTTESMTNNILEIFISTISSTPGVDEKYINKIIESIKEGYIKKSISQIINDNIDYIISSKKYKKYYKKPKDPNAPKQALNQYFHFKRVISPTVKNLSHKDKQKEIGRLWKELSDKEKIKYKNMAIEDKNRYKEELKSYTPCSEFLLKMKEWDKERKEFLKSNINMKGKKTKNNESKRSLTAYNFFCKDKEIRLKVKEENPDINHKEIMKVLGVLWAKYKRENNIEKYKKMVKDKYS